MIVDSKGAERDKRQQLLAMDPAAKALNTRTDSDSDSNNIGSGSGSGSGSEAEAVLLFPVSSLCPVSCNGTATFGMR